MGAEEEEPRERPWWVREDWELTVAANARSSPEGQREIGPYLRTIKKKERAVTCVVCGAAGQRDGYPGPRLRYCRDTCRAEAERQLAAARMRRMRARRRLLSPSP